MLSGRFIYRTSPTQQGSPVCAHASPYLSSLVTSKQGNCIQKCIFDIPIRHQGAFIGPGFQEWSLRALPLVPPAHPTSGRGPLLCHLPSLWARWVLCTSLVCNGLITVQKIQHLEVPWGLCLWGSVAAKEHPFYRFQIDLLFSDSFPLSLLFWIDCDFPPLLFGSYTFCVCSFRCYRTYFNIHI